MNNEWTDLPTLVSVGNAQTDGWEIECCASDAPDWSHWSGLWWDAHTTYRARPAQPKMKKVKMLCYTNEITIDWKNESLEVDEDLWIRVPSQDIEIEIPEDV